MSEIRNLTRNGETFYPLTCTDALLNRDGNPVETINDIFDVSEYNASGTPPVLAKYASLDLALAAIPEAKRKGGMSMRYVQTSDNKYIQARCMAQNFTTDVTQWQGVDNEPTTGSNNLVKSGGVANSIFKKNFDIERVLLPTKEGNILNKKVYPTDFPVVGLLNNEGTVSGSYTDYRTTDFIEVSSDNKLLYKNLYPSNDPWRGICLYDSNRVYIGYIPVAVSPSYGLAELTSFTNVAYFRASTFNTRTDALQYGIVAVVSSDYEINDISKRISDIENDITEINTDITDIQTDLSSQIYTATKNLLDIRLVSDKYINVSGVLTNNSTYWVSNPINVVAGKYIVVSVINKILLYFSYVFYDSSNNIISFKSYFTSPYGGTLQFGKIQVPENAVKCYIGFLKYDFFRSKENWLSLPNQVMIEMNDNGNVSEFEMPSGAKIGYDSYAREALSLSKLVSINSLPNEFGYKNMNIGSVFQSGDYGSYVTVKNSYFTNDGFLNTICLYMNNVTKGAKVKFAIGKLDQRNWAINTRFFELEILQTNSNYLCVFNVRDKNIAVLQGEQLFVQICYDRAVMRFAANISTDINSEMLYGNINGGLHRLQTENGGRVCLFSTINVINTSPFATQNSVNSIEESVNAINAELPSLRYAYDADNNPFKIRVDQNGNIVAIPVNYRNVLALGNSLTTHGQSAAIGYYGNGWAMAATSLPMDWCSHLQNILKQKNNEATVVRKNIVDWERNFATYDNEDYSALLDSVLDSNLDLIIFRAGENSTVTSETQNDFRDGVISMINYIKSKCPFADIVLTSQFWSNTYKNAAIQSASQTLNLPYISTGNSGTYTEKLGDYTFGENNNEYPIIHAGVQSHMPDYGFYIFANLLATAFGYNQLSLERSITVNTALEYFLLNSTGIVGSLISVQFFGNSAPTISIVDGEQNNVSYTVHDMSNVSWIDIPQNQPTFVVTFVMPNSNVTITAN